MIITYLFPPIYNTDLSSSVIKRNLPKLNSVCLMVFIIIIINIIVQYYN